MAFHSPTSARRNTGDAVARRLGTHVLMLSVKVGEDLAAVIDDAQ